MLEFSALQFYQIGQEIESLILIAEQFDPKEKIGDPKAVHDTLNKIQQLCDHISLKASAGLAKTLVQQISSETTTATVKAYIESLHWVIWREVKKEFFLWVPFERARYYQYPADSAKWDDVQKTIEGQIRDRFPVAAREINFARECYALARWTACVFHLMRACEVGLKAIYKTLNRPPPKLSDSWGNLLKPMDEELKKSPPGRFGEWAKHPEFFDHGTNDVRAIKRVWRDSTMHVESNYDESGARKALDAVTSFFKSLSEKLDQDGNVYQQSP